MDKIIKNLKWIIASQIIGLVIMFITYFVPHEGNEGMITTLFVFEAALVFGYWLELFINVYRKLKNNDLDES